VGGLSRRIQTATMIDRIPVVAGGLDHSQSSAEASGTIQDCLFQYGSKRKSSVDWLTKMPAFVGLAVCGPLTLHRSVINGVCENVVSGCHAQS